MLDTTHTDTDTDTYTCMHTDVYIHANMHTCRSTSLDMRCQSANTYIRIYHYTHIRVYVYTYTRACIFADLHTSMHAWWACRAGARDSGLSLNEGVKQLHALDTLIHACQDRNTLIKKKKRSVNYYL